MPRSAGGFSNDYFAAALSLVFTRRTFPTLSGEACWFGPGALVDGVASLLIHIIGLGLNIVAYNRVAS